MNRISVLFHFYKPFIVSSMLVNVIVGVINPNIAATLFTKLGLVIFAWYFMTQTTHKNKLTFYKNLSISPLMLFSFVFIIDSILTIGSISLLKAFN